MAISKILNMRDCGKAFHGKHLKTALDYIMKSEKTQNGRLISAINCQPEYAFEQMRETKKTFNKIDKRQGYHIILSFKEGEADADTVFELTEKFVKEYLSDYEAVFAVHDNTDHPHAHIVFNSVSFKTGNKYRYTKGDWQKYIQPITNHLCEEYGLSTIELDENSRSRDYYKEWNPYRDGKFVWKSMIQRDVDACVIQSATYDGFISMLEDKGYEVKNAHGEGKYLAVKPMGMKRYVRLKTLGEDYSEEMLRKRISEENISAHQTTEKPQIMYCRVKRYKRAKLSGLQKKYYYRLYRIGKLKKKPYSVAWKYKDDIKKMHKLQNQYLLMVKYNLHALSDLEETESRLLEIRKQFSSEKGKLYRANRNNQELFNIIKEMNELKVCEKAYQGGDDFFLQEHKKWMECEKQLSEKGYSFDEVVALKEYYHEKIVRYKELEGQVMKELRTLKAIKEEYVAKEYDNRKIQSEKEKEIEESKQRQPKR